MASRVWNDKHVSGRCLPKGTDRAHHWARASDGGGNAAPRQKMREADWARGITAALQGQGDGVKALDYWSADGSRCAHRECRAGGCPFSRGGGARPQLSHRGVPGSSANPAEPGRPERVARAGTPRRAPYGEPEDLRAVPSMARFNSRWLRLGRRHHEQARRCQGSTLRGSVTSRIAR